MQTLNARAFAVADLVRCHHTGAYSQHDPIKGRWIVRDGQDTMIGHGATRSQAWASAYHHCQQVRSTRVF